MASVTLKTKKFNVNKKDVVDGEEIERQVRVQMPQLVVDLGFCKYHRSVTRFGVSGWKNDAGMDVSWNDVKERIHWGFSFSEAQKLYAEIAEAEKKILPELEEFIFEVKPAGAAVRSVSVHAEDEVEAAMEAAKQGEVVRFVA